MTGGRMAQDGGLGLRPAQRDDDFPKGNARFNEREPGAQAPARHVLAADHERIGHGSLSSLPATPIVISAHAHDNKRPLDCGEPSLYAAEREDLSPRPCFGASR